MPSLRHYIRNSTALKTVYTAFIAYTAYTAVASCLLPIYIVKCLQRIDCLPFSDHKHFEVSQDILFDNNDDEDNNILQYAKQCEEMWISLMYQ